MIKLQRQYWPQDGFGFARPMVVIMAISVLMLVGCQQTVVVKPAGFLRLDYPEPQYKVLSSNCAFDFEYNVFAEPLLKERCALNINYPFGATVYLTYQTVEDDLPELMSDAQKLVYDHTIKASEILEQPRVDPEHKIYGMYYQLDGPAASHAQFYLTDSTRHFLTGALYFNTKPNFDSLYPAIHYVRQDIRHLMETLHWHE